MSLDKIDIAILESLQRGGPVSVRDLAKVLGRSKSAIADRLINLRHNGIILGLRVVFAPSLLGADVDFLMTLDLKANAPVGFRRFEDAIKAVVGVTGCIRISPSGYQVRVARQETLSGVQQAATRCGLTIMQFRVDPVLEEIVPYRDPPLRALLEGDGD